MKDLTFQTLQRSSFCIILGKCCVFLNDHQVIGDNSWVSRFSHCSQWLDHRQSLGWMLRFVHKIWQKRNFIGVYIYIYIHILWYWFILLLFVDSRFLYLLIPRSLLTAFLTSRIPFLLVKAPCFARRVTKFLLPHFAWTPLSVATWWSFAVEFPPVNFPFLLATSPSLFLDNVIVHAKMLTLC